MAGNNRARCGAQAKATDRLKSLITPSHVSVERTDEADRLLAESTFEKHAPQWASGLMMAGCMVVLF